MSSIGSRPLTQRQRAVMERIDRRVPIKVIAQELGVSETRINQHIRALKDIYEADNLGDLVESYRSDIRAKNHTSPEAEAEEKINPEGDLQGLSETAYSKSQVPSDPANADEGVGNDLGQLVISDLMPPGISGALAEFWRAKGRSPGTRW